MAEPGDRSTEREQAQPPAPPEDERTMADLVPQLPDGEELEIMRDMVRMLTEACEVEIVRKEDGARIRNAALIETMMTASSAFRDSGGHDWHFDVVAPVFLKRHAGTSEAAALQKIIDRAKHILGQDR